MGHWAEYVSNLRGARDLCDGERAAYAWLRKSVASGSAVRAIKRPPTGPILENIMDELLHHPFAASLPRRPLLYFHHDPLSQFVTFDDVIMVPTIQAETARLDLPHIRSRFKGALAHELGHILNRDSKRIAQHPELSHSMAIERNADLLAAHMCGDGGLGLADDLESLKEGQKALAATELGIKIAADASTRDWAAKHPPLEDRIRCLRDWHRDFTLGRSLPQPELQSRHSNARLQR